MVNQVGNFGLFSEFFLVSCIAYLPVLNHGLGTRRIPLQHFAIPSFSFYIAIFFYDEARKFVMRRQMVMENDKLKFKGWLY
jgi:Cation transporting ATPase, C-terminus